MPVVKMSPAAPQSLATASAISALLSQWAASASARLGQWLAWLRIMLGKEDTLTFVSFTLVVITLVLLFFSTRGVSLENVQYDIDQREKAAQQLETHKRASLGLGPLALQGTPQSGSSLSVSGNIKADNSNGGVTDAASETKGNTGSANKGVLRSPSAPVSSPSILRWIPALLSSKKKAIKKSDGGNDDGWALSYDGVKEWTPGKHGTLSPQSSIQSTGSQDNSSVRSFSPVGTPRALSHQDKADAAGDDQRMALGRSLSVGDTPGSKQDARTLVGWEVEVQGLGRGVVRNVRKNIWNQSVFSIDFGNKIHKITLKRGNNRFGLPFIPVAKLEGSSK